jgi:hypothetical protein
MIFKRHTFEMADTGIGEEMGYEDDKAFRAAVEAEHAALDPEVRRALEDAQTQIERRMLGL